MPEREFMDIDCDAAEHNRTMPRRFSAALLFALAACSPTLDWRELHDEASGLRMTFPCKPDRAEHRADFAGASRVLLAQGCEAGGLMFAVVQSDLGDAGRSEQALQDWNRATLANIQAQPAQRSHFVPRGALDLPASQRVRAQGRRADGSTIESQAVYFARGTRVFQAVVYAKAMRPEAADTFFTGLGFE